MWREILHNIYACVRAVGSHGSLDLQVAALKGSVSTPSCSLWHLAVFGILLYNVAELG